MKTNESQHYSPFSTIKADRNPNGVIFCHEVIETMGPTEKNPKTEK